MGLSVALVCRIGPPHVGGMESVLSGLARSLIARGHRVRLVTLDRAVTDGSLLGDPGIDGLEVVRLRQLGPRRYPLGLALIAAVSDFDVVHVHGLDGHVDWLAANRRRFRGALGVSTHGGYFHTPRQRRLKELWLRTVTRASFARVDAVWYTSAADALRLGAAGGRGKYLNNGVDIRRFSAVRRRPEDGRLLVWGPIDSHKGVDDLIAVLPSIADKRDVRLRVVGPERRPGMIDELRLLARALGVQHRVDFVGPVDEPRLMDELARCTLAVFPSRYEGFGLTLIETLAAGVPVAARPIPSYQSNLSGAGRLVDFGDRLVAAAQLDEAIAAAGSEPPVDVSRFGWDAAVLAYEDAYAEVLR